MQIVLWTQIFRDEKGKDKAMSRWRWSQSARSDFQRSEALWVRIPPEIGYSYASYKTLPLSVISGFTDGCITTITGIVAHAVSPRLGSDEWRSRLAHLVRKEWACSAIYDIRWGCICFGKRGPWQMCLRNVSGTVRVIWLLQISSQPLVA